jgi:hypothetical protein
MDVPTTALASMLRPFQKALLFLILGLGVCALAPWAAETQTIFWATPTEETVLRLEVPVTLVAAASSGLPVSFRVVKGPAVIEGTAVTATATGLVQIVAEQPGDADHLPVSVVRTFNRPVSVGTRLSMVDTPGSPMDIVVRDGIAFVADGPGGFQIIDVRNPVQPAIVGFLSPIGSTGPAQVAVKGHYAFLGEETRGLRIVDISNPSTPKDVTIFQSQNWVLGVTVAGSRAFLTEFQYGLEIVDISDPLQPVALARYPVTGQASRVWAEGDLAYMTIQFVPGELRVLHLGDPTHPVVLGSTAISLFGSDIQGLGRYAFVAAGNAGIQPVDLGDPRNPVAFPTVSAGEVWGVELSGERVYASGSHGLVVFDISNPAEPVQIGTYPPSAPSGAAAIVGDIAHLLVGDNGVEIVRFREGLAQTLQFDPPALVPTSTTTLNLEATASSGLPVEFAVVSGPGSINGATLSITGPGTVTLRASQAGDAQFHPAQSERAIQVADIPVITTQPAPINLPPGGSGTMSVEVKGGGTLAYQWIRNGAKLSGLDMATIPVTDTASSRGLWQVIVSNAAGSVTSSVVSLTVDLPGSEFTLKPRGSIGGFALGAGSGAPVRTQVRGRHAYVANGWDTNLYVVDIADPDNPVVASKLRGVSPFTGGFEIALIDDFALTAERDQALGIIDISNPLAPMRVGKFPLPGSLANSIVIRDRTAYVGNENGGVVILDVNVPDQPVLLGKASPPSNVNGVFLDENRAFAANWANGLSVVDVTSLTKPVLTRAYSYSPNTSRAFDVVARGNIAYMADSELGLVTLDISRTTGFQVGRVAGSVWDLTLLGRYLFAADARAGLRIFDVSRPTNAVPLGSYGFFGAAIGCTIRGNRAFMGERRFSLVDFSFASMAPAFSSAPETRAVALGSDVTLEANVMGTEPMSFRWFRGDRELQEATGATLELRGVTETALGEYSAVASNAFGTVTNPIARLVASSRIRDTVAWHAPNPAVPLIKGETYTLDAGTGLDRPLQFLIDGGAASLTGSSLKPTANGPLTVRAVAPGDAQHFPTAAVRTFNVISRPQILANSVSTASGRTTFRALVSVGVRFAVMASENLRDWTEITEVTASQANTEFADPDEFRGVRYYRLEAR